ncbi:hypothetical protein L202_05326 [Cryptococcus amylolentus CBS 6039]|uniref:Chromatin assembly factor 1 subunit A n=1 Tax=Cryptococcus amylolentus CBS 6039 TaxID=1295533 RepID=A0A1E3HMN2_9TREE|nr:hypothetical protein L202_05326 [Cryptococcus amylolentus CBS 6039]ODN76691.1 hypothetical protein L202_05326 [Cryptococcus amylolentus CBS 6039]
MANNTAVQNTSPKGGAAKRKVDDVFSSNAKGEEKENERAEKRQVVQAPRSSLVEIKNKKIVFQQAPHNRILPRRKLINLETYLLDQVEEQKQVTEIPEEHWSIIAMAGHELTGATEGIFLKQLKTALNIPTDQDLLPNSVLTPLIRQLFALHQYGFLPSDFPPPPPRLPAHLQIRCWQVVDLPKYFPSEQLELLRTRQEEREKAREECIGIMTSLDDVEKHELLGKKDDKDKETPAKVAAVPKEKPTSAIFSRASEGPEEAGSSIRGSSPVKIESASSPIKPGKTPEEIEAAKAKRQEREEKKAVLAEKKAAKDKEAKKKEEATAKQAKKMSMFFKTKTTSAPKASPASSSSPQKKGKEESDYRRVFRPLPTKKHIQVAKANRWDEQKRSREDKAEEVEGWSSRDFINDHLKRHNHQFRIPRRIFPSGIKSAPINGSIADVWATLQEAEEPRDVFEQLKDRRRFPWKTLAFDQQPRPPYSGTFTKKSLLVGPRTPFAQDPVFDYSIDSGDEWEEDEGGEDVDDFGGGGEKAEEEDDDEDEEEGEFDDWLDDSEQVESEPPPPEVIDVDDPMGSVSKLPAPAKVAKKKEPVKRIVKLVPTWKGPLWETKIGEKGTEGLESYRIQLLNDTPAQIDPFTYISPAPAQEYKADYGIAVIGPNSNVKCLLSAELIPQKPPPSALPKDAPPKPRGVAKSSFPTELLADLYKIVEGDTRTAKDLVPALREQFGKAATKVAIEAELKESAMKGKKGKDKCWRVYKEAWVAAGLTPPENAPSKPAPQPATVKLTSPSALVAQPTAPTQPQSPLAPPPLPPSEVLNEPPTTTESHEPIVVDS